ncbi:MAG: DUF1292 domain-containing protein [Acutalibacteraceae bacterium]
MADEILRNEEETEDNIIVLTDDNGDDQEFEFLDLIEYENEEYIVIIPANDEADEVIILKIESLNDEDEQYVGVEDEETLAAVFEIFKEHYKDVVDFE